MAAGYHAAGETSSASFELFVRELPATRGYLVAAGLEQAIAYLETWRYTPDEVDYLRSVPALRGARPAFFDDYLPGLRFTGDVWAVSEGTPVFAGEPILRVTAPLPEAQLVETALLATILFQTAVASKAARVREAAGERPVIEFGGRRAHGTEAAMYAARAACLAGCRATSNVEAGYRYGLAVSGTMAHSWVMAYPDELTAFSRYAAVYGPRSVLLIDTYDSIAAARRIVGAGLRPAAVRLDSGDLVHLSRAVRGILDAGGLGDTQILASGDLDEHKIAAVVSSGAPIDGFGVGTALSTSSDAPALSGVYKLVEIDRAGTMTPVMKLSAGKRTCPGAKQLWRGLRSRGSGPRCRRAGRRGSAKGRGAALDVCREGWCATAADARDRPDPGCLPDRRGAFPGGGAATSGRCSVSRGPERGPRAGGCHRSLGAVCARHGRRRVVLMRGLGSDESQAHS